MRRLLAVAVVLASGCGSDSSTVESRKREIGSEMLVYEGLGYEAGGWELTAFRPKRITVPFGTRVQWLGSGFTVPDDPEGDGTYDRVRLLDGDSRGVTAYLRPTSLRPFPAK